jgi:hypothetical protein
MERVPVAAKAANVITIERTTTLLHPLTVQAGLMNTTLPDAKSGQQAPHRTAARIRSGVAFLKLRMSQFLSDTSVSTAYSRISFLVPALR